MLKVAFPSDITHILTQIITLQLEQIVNVKLEIALLLEIMRSQINNRLLLDTIQMQGLVEHQSVVDQVLDIYSFTKK